MRRVSRRGLQHNPNDRPNDRPNDPTTCSAGVCSACKFIQMCLGFYWLDTVCAGGLTVYGNFDDIK